MKETIEETLRIKSVTYDFWVAELCTYVIATRDTITLIWDEINFLVPCGFPVYIYPSGHNEGQNVEIQ